MRIGCVFYVTLQNFALFYHLIILSTGAKVSEAVLPETESSPVTNDVANLNKARADKKDSTSTLQNTSTMTCSQSSLNISGMSQVGSCNNKNMYVETSDQKTKRLCCPYCKKRFPKLARHMEGVHKTEKEVGEFRALSPRKF